MHDLVFFRALSIHVSSTHNKLLYHTMVSILEMHIEMNLNKG